MQKRGERVNPGVMQSPLLSAAHPLPFDAISAEQVVPALSALVTQARVKLAGIVSEPSPVSFANCLLALEEATDQLEIASSVVEHLESVVTTPALRQAYNESLPITTAFWTQIPLDAGLYRRIRELSARASELPLTDVERRLLDKTLEEFKRHGAELDEAGKTQLSALDEELSRITAQFSQNVVDATGAWELLLQDATQLSGLPESALDMTRESAKAKGTTGYRLTLQTPCLIAILTYADDRSLRERVWRANDSRCAAAPYDNAALIERIVELRLQKARLLGYQNFGDLVMADRMAKCSATARRFIDELTEKTRDAFVRERQELQAFVDETEGSKAVSLMPWDVGYYAEKLRKQRYAFDEEELRAYFPTEQMLEAVFQTSSELFGIRIEPMSGITTWDPAVRVYAIYDQSGPQLGVFYVDWYPPRKQEPGRVDAWAHYRASQRGAHRCQCATAHRRTTEFTDASGC